MPTTRRIVLEMLGLAVAASALACGATPQADVRPKPRPLPPLKLRPLHRLVTSAGLDWVLLARPDELARCRPLALRASRLIPPKRLATFEQITAIDLRRVKHAVIAGYKQSTLYVIDGVADPRRAERHYRDRLIGEVIRAVHRPDGVLVRGQGAGGEKRAMAALGSETVVVERGDAVHAKVSLMYAMGRLGRVPRALEIADLGSLRKQLGESPLLAFAPGPFEGEWRRGLRGLMAACTAAGMSVRTNPSGELTVHALFSGAWGGDASGAAEHLRQSWDDIANSSVGRLGGLDQPISPPEFTATEGELGLRVKLDGARLLDGLHAAVSAEVRDIMRW